MKGAVFEQSGGSSLKFQRNILPQCSGSMGKPSKAFARRLLLADYFMGSVFDREVGGTVFL
jgi:hypothetical protein